MENNKVITVALAASGLSARVFHVPLLQAHGGFLLQGLVIRSPREVPAAWHTLTQYPHFEAILDSDVDLVVINSPHHLHFAQTKAALLAGKHCLVEKPVCLREAEVEELIELATRQGLVLTAFQNRRFDADFAAAQASLPHLGQVVEAELRFDRWRPLVDTSTWKEQQGQEAGVFWNLMPHLADQALMLFGTPQTVFATERVVRQGGLAPDFVEVQLTYPTAHVRLHVSYLAHPYRTPRLAIMGQQGCFYSHGADRQEELLNAGQYANLQAETQLNPGFVALLTDASGKTTPLSAGQPTYMSIYDALYKAIMLGTPPIVTPGQVRYLARLLDLCRQSINTHQRVPW